MATFSAELQQSLSAFDPADTGHILKRIVSELLAGGTLEDAASSDPPAARALLRGAASHLLLSREAAGGRQAQHAAQLLSDGGASNARPIASPANCCALSDFFRCAALAQNSVIRIQGLASALGRVHNGKVGVVGAFLEVSPDRVLLLVLAPLAHF